MPPCVSFAHLSVAVPQTVSFAVLHLKNSSLDILVKGGGSVVEGGGIAGANQKQLPVVKRLLSDPSLQRKAVFALIDIGHAITGALPSATAMLKHHGIACVQPSGMLFPFALAKLCFRYVLFSVHVGASEEPFPSPTSIRIRQDD